MKILDNVFGKRIDDTFVEGIVDATDDEDFQEKLSSVKESWRSLGTTSSCNLEKLINYFNENKVSVLHDTMSKSRAVQALANSQAQGFMILEQRKNHLFQVQCVLVCNSSVCMSLIHSLTPSEPCTSTLQLSVTAESAAEILNVRTSCLPPGSLGESEKAY